MNKLKIRRNKYKKRYEKLKEVLKTLEEEKQMLINTIKEYKKLSEEQIENQVIIGDSDSLNWGRKEACSLVLGLYEKSKKERVISNDNRKETREENRFDYTDNTENIRKS